MLPKQHSSSSISHATLTCEIKKVKNGLTVFQYSRVKTALYILPLHEFTPRACYLLGNYSQIAKWSFCSWGNIWFNQAFRCCRVYGLRAWHFVWQSIMPHVVGRSHPADFDQYFDGGCPKTTTHQSPPLINILSQPPLSLHNHNLSFKFLLYNYNLSKISI